MTRLEEVAQRLYYIATAFTRQPVRIRAQDSEQMQTGREINIILPAESPKQLNPEQAFAYYQGLTSLQASAVRYRTHEYGSDFIERTHARFEKTFLRGIDSGDPYSILARMDNGSGFCTGVYNAVELCRRKRLLCKEYPPLDEDFSNAIRMSVNTADVVKVPEVRELPRLFALATRELLWTEYGITHETFRDSLESEGEKDRYENTWRFVKGAAQQLGSTIVAEEAFWVTADILEAYARKHGPTNLLNPFYIKSREEMINLSIEMQKNNPILHRLVAEEMIAQYDELPQFTRQQTPGGIDPTAMTLINDELYSKSRRLPGARAHYYPEVRSGIRESNVTTVHEMRSMPGVMRTDEAAAADIQRNLDRIEGIETQLVRIKKKCESDVSTIYNWDELQKERNKITRERGSLRKRNKALHQINQPVHRVFPFNASLLYRIEEDMQLIRPTRRTKLRKLEAGELDHKRYLHYLEQTNAGASPKPDFFWKWKTRVRDTATLILIDASASTEQMVDDHYSILDRCKEAALYLSSACTALGDSSAIALYHSVNERDVRVYLVKGFEEEINPFRFAHVIGRHNNRDGAAIRWATDYLATAGSRTPFLFHISDFSPSDATLEGPAYRGTMALEDCIDAFRHAQSCGVIPYGFAIQREQRQVLALKGTFRKIRREKPEKEDMLLHDRLREYYSRVRSINDLPNELVRVYTEIAL